MLKLALLGGARGVAANVLWGRALDLQKVHDWDRLKLTVDQITKLQPHFLRVWSWQGWNLAYNVSVEWDAPEDKYEWIKQGIKFLKEGVRKNEKSPDLMWDTAWTYLPEDRRRRRGDHPAQASSATTTRPDFRSVRGRRRPARSRRATTTSSLGYGWFSQAPSPWPIPACARRLTSAMEAPVEYVDRVENRKGHPGDLHFRTMPASSPHQATPQPWRRPAP